jgi:hypothetical protein
LPIPNAAISKTGMSSSEDATTGPAKPKRPATLGEKIFGHAILLIFCVGLPVIFTAVAPLSVVHLWREGAVVNATVSKRLLFIIPFSRAMIRDVQSVGNQFVAGSSERRRTTGSGSRTAKTEDTAFLEIEGADGVAKVEVSPVNIKSVKKKAEAFIEDPAQSSLSFAVIANWKFGVIAGGILSLLTVIYVYAMLSSLIRWGVGTDRK